MNWLCKDIIVVFVPSNQNNLLKQWSYDYHNEIDTTTTTKRSFSTAYSMIRSNSYILAGLSIDIIHDHFNAYNILSANPSGQLSNLDLISTIDISFSQEQLTLVHNKKAINLDILSSHNTILRFMRDCIYGYNPYTLYHGVHSYFNNLNIDMVSLVSYQEDDKDYEDEVTAVKKEVLLSDKKAQQDVIFIKSFKVFYHIIRALNNLSEKFHHSTNLYLIADDHQFITMNKYFYALILIGLPLPLHAIFRLRQDNFKKQVLISSLFYAMILISSAMLFYIICIQFTSYKIHLLWIFIYIFIHHYISKRLQSSYEVTLLLISFIYNICTAAIAILNFSLCFYLLTPFIPFIVIKRYTLLRLVIITLLIASIFIQMINTAKYNYLYLSFYIIYIPTYTLILLQYLNQKKQFKYKVK